MSQFNQNQHQVTYPPPPTSYSAAHVEGPFVAPPPAGYPTKDGAYQTQNHSNSVETQSRGDGFWKGCCAALCCCCVLDACF